MNRQTASKLVEASFDISRAIAPILARFKNEFEPGLYQEVARDLAAIIDDQQRRLIGRAFDAFPDLAEEVEQSIAKTGTYRPLTGD